jgi:acetoin utilization deacetylase AcuC-like enzyme
VDFYHELANHMAIFYHQDTTKTTHAFDTTRKGADIADYLTHRGWQIQEPTPISQRIAERYHDAAYIKAIQRGVPIELAESQGFMWDEMMWRSVTAQTGAMLDAAHHACQHGRAYALSAGFHHARTDSGAGFCTLNGLAIAAGEILGSYPDRRVIILDVDAHCGGGTMDICDTWERLIHLDIHTNSYDAYAVHAPHHRQSVSRADLYIPTLQQLLAGIEAQIKPHDVLVYNAGMDIHEDCRIGGLRGITREIIRQREQYVSDRALAQSLSVVACLAGGYAGGNLDHDTLIELHAMSVEILLSTH